MSSAASFVFLVGRGPAAAAATTVSSLLVARLRLVAVAGPAETATAGIAADDVANDADLQRRGEIRVMRRGDEMSSVSCNQRLSDQAELV